MAIKAPCVQAKRNWINQRLNLILAIFADFMNYPYHDCSGKEVVSDGPLDGLRHTVIDPEQGLGAGAGKIRIALYRRGRRK